MSQLEEDLKEINTIIDKAFINKNVNIDHLANYLTLKSNFNIKYDFNKKLDDKKNLINQYQKVFEIKINEMDNNDDFIKKIRDDIKDKKSNLISILKNLNQLNLMKFKFDEINSLNDYDNIGKILFNYTTLVKTTYKNDKYDKIKPYLIQILQDFMYNILVFYFADKINVVNTDAFQLIMFNTFFSNDCFKNFQSIYEIELLDHPEINEIIISPYLHQFVEEDRKHYLSMYFDSVYDFGDNQKINDIDQITQEDYNNLPNNMKLKHVLYDILITYRNIIRHSILNKLLSIKQTSNENYEDIIKEIQVYFDDNKIDTKVIDFLDDILFIDLKDSYIFNKLTSIDQIKNEKDNNTPKNVPTANKIPKKLLNKYLERIIYLNNMKVAIIDILEYMYDVVSVLVTDNSKVFNEYNAFTLISGKIINKIHSNRQTLDKILSFLKDNKKDEINEISKNNGIMTYLSIRADRDEVNPRYIVTTDNNQTVALINYRNDIISGKVDNALYDKYLVGPFTKIFYNKPALSMIDDMQNLFDKIINKNDAIIIGYGASGSGKTSTLIYRPKNSIADTQSGLLPAICNHIHKLKGVNEIDLNMVEILGIEGEKISDLARKLYSSKKFVFKNDNFYLKDNIPNESTSEGTIFTIKDFKGTKYVFDTNLSIDKYIYIILDTIRKTYPTTNNDKSSRSHILIFIKFGDNLGKLVICDFAGIENTFDCANGNVIKNFQEIKYNEKNEDGNIIAAYDPILDNYIDNNYKKYLDLLSINDKSFKNAVKTIIMDENVLKYKTLFTELLDFILIIKNTKYVNSDGEGIVNSKAITSYYNALKNYKLTNDQINSLFTILAKIMGRSIPNFTKNMINTLSFEPIYKTITTTNVMDSVIITILNYVRNNTTKELIKKECNMRNAEGAFINRSLMELRGFISKTLRSRGITPNYIDICAPLQCNPKWGNCFEQLDNENKTSEIIKHLNDEKIDIENKKSLLIIFNVFNISATGVVDPPKVPFIDTSDLSMEYNRLKNIDIILDIKSLNIVDEKIQIVNEIIIDKISSDINKFKDYISNTNNVKITELIQKIKNNNIKIDNLVNKDTKVISDKSQFNTLIEETMKNIHILLNEIDTMRAANPLSTVLFLDMMAKFGLGKNICMIPSDQKSDIIDKLTFNNLKTMFENAQNLYSKAISSK